MLYLIKKFFHFLSKKFINNINMGSSICVYFPNVDKYYMMEVSSIKLDAIKAKFDNENDWNDSNVETDYGQMDNDIVLDKIHLIPIDMRNNNENK